MCAALLRPTLNDRRPAKRAFDVAANCNRKYRECGAFPPSRGARPALRFPRSPPVWNEWSFRKTAKARQKTKRLDLFLLAIDFHTGTTGFEVTAFNIAGMDVPEVRAMAELYPVSQIFDNHVYPGVLHNAFMDVGIPAFTPEIGAARVLNLEMISLFVEGMFGAPLCGLKG
jgi:predicted deacylase